MRIASSVARFVYGPIATIVAPDSTLSRRSTIASPGRDRARRDRLGPVARVGRDPARRLPRRERHVGAGRDGNVGAAGELEAARDEAGADAARIDGGRDADDLDVGPAEQHRERARVVGVGTEIGVEMDAHHRLLRRAGARRATRCALRPRSVGSDSTARAASRIASRPRASFHCGSSWGSHAASPSTPTISTTVGAGFGPPRSSSSG